MLRKIAVLFIVGVWFMLAIGICLWLAKGNRTPFSGWGQGKLDVAERAYYVGRVTAIGKAWQHVVHQATRDRDGRIEESGFTCLVIDTTKKRLWLETDGRPLPEYEIGLPSSMEWKLQRSTPEGQTELGSPCRLRIHGIYSNRMPPEQIFLIGEQEETLYFSFTPSGCCGNGYSNGPLTKMEIKWNPPPQQADAVEKYESLVVGNEEYERAKTQFGTNELPSLEPTPLKENQAAWHRVEEQLYQEIDRQISSQGLQLKSLKLTTGPDYTGASAELQAARSGLLKLIHPGTSSWRAYLQIDSLGNDVWYAKSAPHPLHPIRQPMSLKTEFLVSATGSISREDRSRLLAEGQQKQQNLSSSQPPKWRATLPNGAAVEFMGVCDNPSGGKPWWGPDGSPLGTPPYVNYEPYGNKREDHAIYEIAWRVDLSQQQGPSETRSTLEGDIGSYSRTIHDRYGNPLHSGLEARGYAFEKSRDKTTLRVAVTVNNGPIAWVTFRNIALVAGKNMGFEIVQGDADIPWK